MQKRGFVVFGIIFLFLIGFVSALDFEREYRLNFGHIVYIKSVGISDTSEANVKKLDIEIENTGNRSILDVRTQIVLPSEIHFSEDTSRRKLAKLHSGESVMFSYDLVYSPGIEEGVYNAEILTDYVNHIGDERQDNDTFGIIVRKDPQFFVDVEKSAIYKGNSVGDITIKLVNNDISDIKFLTVELEEDENYKIISSSREYVGDLDSDDFESVDFRIKVKKTKDDMILPLKLDYKDSMNNEYQKNVEAVLKFYSAKELGIEKDNTFLYVLGFILILGVGYYIYKVFFKKKKKFFDK